MRLLSSRIAKLNIAQQKRKDCKGQVPKHLILDHDSSHALLSLHTQQLLINNVLDIDSFLVFDLATLDDRSQSTYFAPTLVLATYN